LCCQKNTFALIIPERPNRPGRSSEDCSQGHKRDQTVRIRASPQQQERGIPEKTIADLVERGHEVRRVGGYERALFGRGQVILRDEQTGILTGGSDPRADGCAMTLI